MSPEDRAVLVCDIAAAVREAHIPPQLSDEELQWVRLAISAEARKIRFRDAVIEKTFAGLAWAAIAGLGYLVLDFAKNHGFK